MVTKIITKDIAVRFKVQDLLHKRHLYGFVLPVHSFLQSCHLLHRHTQNTKRQTKKITAIGSTFICPFFYTFLQNKVEWMVNFRIFLQVVLLVDFRWTYFHKFERKYDISMSLWGIRIIVSMTFCANTYRILTMEIYSTKV